MGERWHQETGQHPAQLKHSAGSLDVHAAAAAQVRSLQRRQVLLQLFGCGGFFFGGGRKRGTKTLLEKGGQIRPMPLPFPGLDAAGVCVASLWAAKDHHHLTLAGFCWVSLQETSPNDMRRGSFRQR